VPLLDLPDVAIVAVNVAGSAGLHAGTGWVAHRMSDDRLVRDGPLLRLREFEGGGRWYERRVGIRGWKDRVPEAGAFFAGGRSKRRLEGRTTADLERFSMETRRAERAHWLALAGAPLFVLVNPPIGVALMLAYGLGSNLPFIAIQRYNRARTTRVLERRGRRRSS
jgi:glycosyl-4,4'-diaponeurosporenoate acyltransferase